MASPLPTRKKSVDVSTPAPRVSRIRRDPPPAVKEISTADIEERESWAMVTGIIAFALALFVILLALSNAAGWSLSEYTFNM